MRIADVAYRCGFVDSAHFSRSFRQRFGTSPREFRQQKAGAAVESPSVRGQRASCTASSPVIFSDSP